MYSSLRICTDGASGMSKALQSKVHVLSAVEIVSWWACLYGSLSCSLGKTSIEMSKPLLCPPSSSGGRSAALSSPTGNDLGVSTDGP